MHRKYNMTKDEFIRHGSTVYHRSTFENVPYDQLISIVLNQLDWDAVTTYLFDRDGVSGNTPPLSKYSNDYLVSGGYTLSYVCGRATINVIGLHADKIDSSNPFTVQYLLNALAHELQHCLVKLEKKEKINSINEEEPRAYATGYMFEQALKIVQHNANILICSTPFELANVVQGIYNAPQSVISNLPTLAVSSALRDLGMAYAQSTVQHSGNDWSATTYFTHGV